MSGAGLRCWQGQPWYTKTYTQTLNAPKLIPHLSYLLNLLFYPHTCVSVLCSCLELFVNFICACPHVSPLPTPLSSECSGSVVPSERETACSPAPCTVPGRWTQRRPQQQQSGKCVSSQTRALWRGCRGGKKCLASTCCPFSHNSGLHHSHSTYSPPSYSTEHCPPACVARSGGSCSNQTSLGYYPATEFGLSGDKYPALQPHRQLCQLTAQPQRSQPVTIMEQVETMD